MYLHARRMVIVITMTLLPATAFLQENCPAAQLTKNDKCIKIKWATDSIPPNIPDTIYEIALDPLRAAVLELVDTQVIMDSTEYTYQDINSSGGGACNASDEPFTGILFSNTFGLKFCFYLNGEIDRDSVITSAPNPPDPCPDATSLSKNGKCIKVIWDPEDTEQPRPAPDILPTTLFEIVPGTPPDTIEYGYVEGDGSPGSPAVYQDVEDTGNCDAALGTPLTGCLYDPRVKAECCYNMGVLPVSLIGFSVSQEAGVVRLQWSTAFEYDNLGFDVQRSADGVEWASIAWVAGEGNSDAIVTYEAVDPSPYPGVSYYRLKQEDFDGEYEFSPIVAVNVENGELLLRVDPNPASARVHIAAPEGAELVITDMSGRIVTSRIMTSNVEKVDVSGLAAGVYIVTAETRSGVLHTAKLMKD